MAIKDITLGQYFPGDTPIHRLDPRTKLLFVIFYIVAIFLAKTLAAYGLLLAVLLGHIALAKARPRAILRSLRSILMIVIITGILNIFYTPGRELWSWGFLRVTEEGLWAAGFFIARIALLISSTYLLTCTTSPIALTDGLERLLGPLKVLRVPVHELAMMMSIALRMIPTLVEETDKIMSAQRARGADFDSGNLFQKAKSLIPLLVPLFVSAFRRADELAVAMECRCYHGGEGRTRMKILRFRPADGLVLLFGTALCVGIVLLARMGF